MHTMYIHHTHPKTSGSTVNLLPYIMFSVFFLVSNLPWPYLHECGALHWSTVHPPGATVIKKTVSLPTLPSTFNKSSARAGGLCSFLEATLQWWRVWSCPSHVGCHRCCACGSSVISRWHCSALVLPCLWLLQSLHSLQVKISEYLGEGVWYRCPTWGWALHRHFPHLD